MAKSIEREMLIPQSRDEVWLAITDRATLAEWMFPNDFEPRVGHRFAFQVPPNPKVNFEGLTVHCEVLECEPPSKQGGGKLTFSWSAGELANTQVSFRLEPDGKGTRLLFTHSGFDLSLAFGEQAFKGAEYGWAKMLGQLVDVVAARSPVFSTQRVISASSRQIFAAFEQAEKLAAWWGPSGFTNTFEQFDFKPGGRWVFVMHGPNGIDYPNENVFREIEPDTKIVIEHIVEPLFKLTVVLTPRGEQTHLSWVQVFESAEFAAKVRAIIEPANEQNLDRLEAVLGKGE